MMKKVLRRYKNDEPKGSQCLKVEFHCEIDFLDFASVGFHRYILKNFMGDTIDVVEQEVHEFDAPSEVSIVYCY